MAAMVVHGRKTMTTEATATVLPAAAGLRHRMTPGMK